MEEQPFLILNDHSECNSMCAYKSLSLLKCGYYKIPKEITEKYEISLDKKDKCLKGNLDSVLEYFKEQNVKLKLGDLVFFKCGEKIHKISHNDYLTIFDGNNLILLSGKDKKLPKIFRVITPTIFNNELIFFPLYYWHNIVDINKGNNIRLDTHIWFDHALYREELIKNIKYGKLHDNFHIYTSFGEGGVGYTLVLSTFRGLSNYNFFGNIKTLKLKDRYVQPLKLKLLSYLKNDELMSITLVPYYSLEYEGDLENMLFIDLFEMEQNVDFLLDNQDECCCSS
jgi:hypothetical protein